MFFIEGSLHLIDRSFFDGKTASSDLVLAERIFFGRERLSTPHPPVAKFDPLVGWVSLRPVATTPSSRPVVAFFGDSWTYGLGVSEGEAFPAQFETLRPDLSARNYGVPGYGIDQMVLLAERVVPELKPRWIVVSYIDDDMVRSCFPFTFGKRKPRWRDFEGNHRDLNWIRNEEELKVIHLHPWERALDVGLSQFFRLRVAKLFLSVATLPLIDSCMARLNAGVLGRAHRAWGERVIFLHIGGKATARSEGDLIRGGVPVVNIIPDGFFPQRGNHPGPEYHRELAKRVSMIINQRERLFNGS